jgi:thioredoxin 1
MLKGKSQSVILTEADFREKILKMSGIVLVEIGADWCGTCEIMAPIIERLAADYQGKIMFVRLDMERHRSVIKNYSVSKLPCLLIFRNGQLVDQIIGMVSRRVLDRRIVELLEGNNAHSGS